MDKEALTVIGLSILSDDTTKIILSSGEIFNDFIDFVFDIGNLHIFGNSKRKFEITLSFINSLKTTDLDNLP